MANPEQLRAHRRQLERARDVLREEYIEARRRELLGLEPNAIVPELIPSERDFRVEERALRRAAARAKLAEPGTAKRRRLQAAVFVQAVQVLYVRRVLMLDPLERAALTPARLLALHREAETETAEQVSRAAAEARAGREEVHGGRA